MTINAGMKFREFGSIDNGHVREEISFLSMVGWGFLVFFLYMFEYFSLFLSLYVKEIFIHPRPMWKLFRKLGGPQR